MKQTVLRLMHESGAFSAVRLANRHKALILTYHRFSENGGEGRTSARELAEQLEYLAAHYRLVSLATLIDHLQAREPLPAGLAAVTIDDGYRDAYEVAFPVLRHYGVPATLFAVTRLVDGEEWLWTDKIEYAVLNTKAVRFEGEINGQPFDIVFTDRVSRLRAAERLKSCLKTVAEEIKQAKLATIVELLDVELPARVPAAYTGINWQQAREMEAAGVGLASHTLSHPVLTQVGDAQLDCELRESKARVEDELRRPADLFCYPNGDLDARVMRAAKRAGYRAGVTVEEGLNERGCDPLALRRIHTDSDFTHFVQRTSGFEQMKNRLRYALAKTAS